MEALVDNCVPKRLKDSLHPHRATHVSELGWSGLDDGSLLSLADGRFDCLITVDQNISRQRNLRRYRVALIVLRAPTNRLPDLLPLVPDLLAALDRIEAGGFAPGGLYEIGPK